MRDMREWWSGTWIVPLVLFWLPLATLLATTALLIWWSAVEVPRALRYFDWILRG